MTPAARLAAAIEIFANLESERRPAADALKSWGLAHRFAGSGDRSAIAGLVYDALRRRASSAYLMGAETPRAVLLGMLKRERGLDTEAIAKLADGSGYGPPALSDDERKRLDAADMTAAPAYVAGDYPEWLEPHFSRAFGDARAEEGAALSSRAPLDLRVNTLKADRDKVGRDAVRLAARDRALVALGLARSHCRRCQEPGGARRAGVHQRHGRIAGRRLATGRAVFRRQARRAGGRSLRRRRRQDLGAWRR